MSIPFHLDSTLIPLNYFDSLAITDVADIITQFRTQAVTGLGWTEPSSNLFKTPVTSGGKFMDILMTRISATVLEIRVRDNATFSIFGGSRRIHIDSTGTAIRYFTNTRGAAIESLRAAPPEVFHAHVMAYTPDLDGDHDQAVVGTAYRTSADAVDGNGSNAGILYAKDNGAAAAVNRMRRYDLDLSNANNIPIFDVTGALPTKDATPAINFGGTFRWAGRLCHMIVHERLGHGTVLRPNIDDSTQAPFKVLGLAETPITQKISMRCT